MVDQVELLPCPFCGTAIQKLLSLDGRPSGAAWHPDAECILSGCGIPSVKFAGWNARARVAEWQPIETAPQELDYVLVAPGYRLPVSHDAVAQITAIISRVVYQHEAIEPAAHEILEASHHAELVAQLRRALWTVQAVRDQLADNSVTKLSRVVMAHERLTALLNDQAPLAKIGGDA